MVVTTRSMECCYQVLSVLTKPQGWTVTNRWNWWKIGWAIAWRNRNQLVVEICGVLGRLHSSQGLARSNNNAKLNYSAKQQWWTAINRWNRWKIGWAIAWRNRNLLVVEICGVVGRLHSSQGLARPNNNAKLNYSAKHETILLATGAKDRWMEIAEWQ